MGGTCGYFEAATSDGCTPVEGYCSPSYSSTRCRQQATTLINDFSTDSGRTARARSQDCCSSDKCNLLALTTTRAPANPHVATAVALGMVGFWIFFCVCGWGTCAAIIAIIVCCVMKNSKKRKTARFAHTTTTKNTTVMTTQPQNAANPHAAIAVAPVAVHAAPVVPYTGKATAYPATATATAYPAAVPTASATAVAVVPPTAYPGDGAAVPVAVATTL